MPDDIDPYVEELLSTALLDQLIPQDRIPVITIDALERATDIEMPPQPELDLSDPAVVASIDPLQSVTHMLEYAETHHALIQAMEPAADPQARASFHSLDRVMENVRRGMIMALVDLEREDPVHPSARLLVNIARARARATARRIIARAAADSPTGETKPNGPR